MLRFFADRGRAPSAGASRYSDLAVVAGLVAVIALMILPLPLFLIDTLVAINITFAAVLLLSAIYVRGPLDLAVFPSVLLMSTLFRLALSVATTRLILLQADAGSIIETFGDLVAGGNVVVGLVVFLIITVVQFMVIAKGAERVAEVAARFSLDGMPGKQMSIDSDLRSGLLTKAQAVEKRRVLELESKLYGSLDGAMKFVKGDAMASIVIILINILGGLAIGIGQRGMPVGSALETYSILTIGDGLVAQVPALLSAMAAGLIVTRTAGDEDETHLGDALGRQFGRRPRVLVVAGAICLLLAAVPGFPTITFCLIASVLVGLGVLRMPGVLGRMAPTLAPRIAAQAAPLLAPARRLLPAPPAQAGVRAGEAPEQRPFVPLLVETPLLAEAEAGALSAALDEAAARIQLSLGLAVPAIALHTGAAAKGWRLYVHETPVAGGDETGADEVTASVEAQLRREAHLLIGIQETNQILNAAGGAYPDVVQEVARALPVPQIANVLRDLIAEGVSIRDQRALLEALAEAAPKATGTHELVEAARIGLRRHIVHAHTNEGTLRALRLDAGLEAELRGQLQQDKQGIRLAVAPERGVTVARAVASATEAFGCQIVLTQLDLRRALRDLCRHDADVTVLSYHEITPGVALEEAGVIALAPEAPSAVEANAAGLTPALAE